MYGKIFENMFTGSMVGAGAIKFALMSYVIANFRIGRDGVATVELNPVLLACILGESVKDVEAAIEWACSPDPKTHTPGEEGRRLVRQGEYIYRVVNGPKYRAIRNEDIRREQNKDAQARFRAKRSGGKSSKTYEAGERRYVAAVEAGNETLADAIAAEPSERINENRKTENG